MKISPVNNSYVQKKTVNNNQSFNGLWGKPTSKCDIDPILSVPKIYKTFYYYPFIGESKESIKSNVDKVNHAELRREDGLTKYYVRECKVCVDTEATKEEYEEYINVNNPKDVTDKMVDIHKAVKGKLRDCPLDAEPRSAQNPVVSKAVQ